jgi:membrane protease YdiL (CAAX protease family)
MINTPNEELKKEIYSQHPALQFLSFILILIGFIVVANLLGAGIVAALYGLNTLMNAAQGNMSAPHAISALWIIQVVGTTLPIFTAPVFYASVVAKNSDEYLKPAIRFHWALIILVFCIMFISSPLIELLSNINQKMVLPHFLDGLEKWMRNSEDAAQKMTTALLQMKTVWDLIFNVVVIGLLTAIAEEFMFRGVIQTIFIRWTKNVHIAVWITAILFSAFHLEFFGFLPRLLLGALFGYFVAWSGSIWPGVWGHFINNSTAVIVTYLFSRKKITLNPDDQHVFNYAGYIVSLLIVLFLLYTYRNITLNKKQALES